MEKKMLIFSWDTDWSGFIELGENGEDMCGEPEAVHGCIQKL